MTLFGVWLRLLIFAPLALLLSGCFPMDNNSADEEKDPHYLAGKARVSSMDYEGAINCFESALVSNPKSAAAHLELGFLYEEKKGNYASAIYHFERHLELKPASKWAETVKQHVFSCKLELAKTVSFALVSRQVQDDMRRLYAKNTALVERIQVLTNQLAEQALSFSNQLALASKVSMPLPDADPEFTPDPERRSPQDDRRPNFVASRPTVVERQTPPPKVTRPAVSPSSVPRSHVVKPGETLAAISKRYNVKLSALQMANPYVDARRMRAGQVLNIPGSRH